MPAPGGGCAPLGGWGPAGRRRPGAGKSNVKETASPTNSTWPAGRPVTRCPASAAPTRSGSTDRNATATTMWRRLRLPEAAVRSPVRCRQGHVEELFEVGTSTRRRVGQQVSHAAGGVALILGLPSIQSILDLVEQVVPQADDVAAEHGHIQGW